MAYDYEHRPAGSAMLARDWRGFRERITARHGVAEVALPAPRAALSYQSITGGQATIEPVELADAVAVGLASSVMRRVATVVQVPDAADFLIPVSAPTYGELVGENGVTDAEDLVFGMLRMGLYKWSSKKVYCPQEWFEDARERGLRALVLILTRRIARIQNQLFTIGTGASQPLGLVTGAAVTVERVGSSFVFDDLVDLYGSLAAEHHEDSADPPAFMMHPTSFATLSKAKDGSGGYLNKLRRTFLDAPILLNPHMGVVLPTGNATVRPALFGKFSEYRIRDGDNLRFVRSLEAVNAIEQDSSLCFATLRSDGGLLVADSTRPPVVALQMN